MWEEAEDAKQTGESITIRHEPTKKDILHLKIKKEPQIDGRRGAYTLIKAHTCQVGDK